MKARLTITIEENILSDVKHFALKQHISISKLVENYFSALTKSAKKKNIIDLIENLEVPIIEKDADLKELYYKNQTGKHGF